MTDAGVAFVSIVPSMRGFSGAVATELRGGLDGPSRDAGTTSGRSFMDGFSQSLTRGGSAVAGLGDKLTIGLGVPLALLGNKATDLASDTNEAFSKVETVFGRSSRAIDSFASAAAQNFGLSRRAALDAAGGFGNMFTQMEIGQDEAAAMSQTMIGLAADFASFHNADVTQVLEAQSAAFRGEFDALQRFVPMINAATVEQQALAMTGKESTSELTNQEKALATYALMMDGAGAATDDFARTQDSLANQERIAAAEAENAAAAFGQNLIPIKQQLIKVASELVTAFNNLSPAQQEMITKAGVLAVALGPVLSVFGRLMSGVGSVIRGAAMFGRGVATMARAGVTLVRVGAQGAMAFGRLAVAAGQAGVAVIRAGAQMLAAAVRATAQVVASIATQIARWVLLGVQSLLAAAKVALAWIISLGPIGIIAAAIIAIAALVITHFDTVKRWITTAFEFVKDKVMAAFNWIKTNWPLLLAILTGPIGLAVLVIVRNWDKIKAGFSAVKDWIKARIDDVVAFFRAWPGRVLGFVTRMWQTVREKATEAKDWIDRQIDSVIGFFRAIPGRVSSAISGIVDTITGPFRRAFNSIRRLWNRTVGGFGFSVPSWIPVVGGKSFRIPRMHSGGIIGGRGDVPIMARAGEGIFTPDQMAAIGAGLDAAAGADVQIILGAGDRDLMRWLRRQVRVRGGDVTTTLASV